MNAKKERPYLNVLKRFLEINREAIPGFITAVFFLIVSMVLQSGISLCTGNMLDCVSSQQMDIFIRLSVGLCSLQAVKLVIGYQVNYRINHLSETCVRRMRSYTYEHISRASMRWLDNHKLGDIISRVNGDLNALVEAVSRFLTWEVSDIIRFFVCMVICFIVNWKLSLMSFCMIPVIGFLQMNSGRPIAKLGEKRSEAEGRVSAVFMDFLGGLSISKAFGMEHEISRKYGLEVEEAVKANVKSFRMEFVLFPLQMLLNFLPTLCITALGTYSVLKGQMTLGAMVSFIMIAGNAFEAVGGMSWAVRDIYNTIGIANRVFELWDVETEPEGGTFLEKGSAVPVEFKQVHFGYSREVEILHSVDFCVKPGEQIALVGASGSGKSTIMKLLAGFYEQTEGAIELYGHERKQWSTKALRKHIAYVGQDAFLFPGTIMSNVLLGKKGATEAEAREVLRAVGLEQLDAEAAIGERGVMLSGGQRQRICIARALLKDADLVLLDEPTSALDTESEHQVQEALTKLMRGKTTIMIAHRLSAMHYIDRIICLADGRIVEKGTHEELMKLGGVYRALYEKQAKGGSKS